MQRHKLTYTLTGRDFDTSHAASEAAADLYGDYS